MTLTIPIRARRIALVLAVIAVYLALQSILGRAVEESYEGSTTVLIANLVRVFNVNRESSIPAWYSSSLLLGCAGLFALVAASKHDGSQPYTRHWTGLAVIFLYLSIDESAAIHEKFTQPLQVALNPESYLYFAWIIVFVPLVTVFALVYFKFLLHLPSRFRGLFVLSAILYVGGAVVIEAISANQWYLDGGTSLFYSAVGTLEELCEMLGVILLIYTLLSYMKWMQVIVRLEPQAQAETEHSPVGAYSAPTRTAAD
jgi:hypothetical protein